MRVAVGMSGGVDSSVAALLLKEQGHDVAGIYMSIWDYWQKGSHEEKNSCYGPGEKEDIAEAKRGCDSLGIPFYVYDCSREYRRDVLGYFKSEYISGRTPNPCIICNQRIKFGVLLRTAEKSGLKFDRFATGHYAKLGKDAASGRYLLKRAKEKRKDQTYFLHRLSQEQLSMAVFPLHDLTKAEVRDIARSNGLRVSDKKESQDFYSGDYRELLDVKDAGGDIILTDGRIIGRHSGLWNYTPGQRKGLGIAFSEPLYVLRLDKEKNAVIVGPRDKIIDSVFIVNELNWIAFKKPADGFSSSVKIRSSGRELPARVEPLDEIEVKVSLEVSGEAVSPGQSAVFYKGDLVIGGGMIKETCSD